MRYERARERLLLVREKDVPLDPYALRRADLELYLAAAAFTAAWRRDGRKGTRLRTLIDCRDCGRRRSHAARGLCDPCYRAARANPERRAA